MSSIDSRIVTMKFDNATFKTGVASTLDLLGKLKTAVSGLAGPTATKGLSSINTAASHFNLNNVSQQVSGVSASFTAMATVAVTALATITHKAVESGLAFAKSFTIGPILDGLHEYETNLQSIQTIQANTDKPLPVINKALQELNKYSDQTIYNFSEMARNIGTFTAAGVDLKTATSSIKGIANMAALSGSSSQQAATAMYQLSQAISSGRVGLQDWNSVVNAGMGGKKLQNALGQTAIAMGTIEKGSVKLVGPMKKLTIMGDSFRQSITAKPGTTPWLDSEVLVNTLASLDGRFSKAALKAELLANGTHKYTTQAQIANEIEKNRAALAKKGVVYSKEQFQEMMKLSDASFLAATQVKTLGQVFDVAKETIGSGWAATFQNIFGDFGQAKKTFTDLSNTINGFINQNSLARNKVLAAWNKKGGRAAMIDGIKNAFIALGHILGPIHDAFREVFPAKTADDLLSMTERFRDFTEGLIAGKGTMGNVHDIFKAIFGVIAVGVEIVKGVLHYFTSLIGLLAGGTGGLLDFSGSLAQIISHLTDWILKGDYIKRFFDTVIAGRAKMLGPIIEMFSHLLSILAGFVRSGTGVALDAITASAAFLAPILSKVVGWLQQAGVVVKGQLVAAFDRLMPSLSEVVDWLQQAAQIVQVYLIGAFEKLKPVLDSVKNAVVDAFGSIMGGAGALGGLGSLFDMGGTTDAAVSGIDNVKSALSTMAPVATSAKSGLSGFVDFLKGVGNFLLEIGKFIGGIAHQIVSDINTTFTDAGGTMFGSVGKFFGGFVKYIVDVFKGLNFGEVILILNTALTAAIGGGIARAFWQFGGMFKDLRSVIGGIGSEVFGKDGIISQASSNLKTMQNEVRSNIILKIAIALAILAASLYVLSTIDPAALARSLGALAAMLILVVYSLTVLEDSMPKDSKIKDAARLGALSAVLVGLGLAMLAMAAAVYILGQMKPEELAKGLGAVVAILATLTIASQALDKSGGGAAMIRAAIALGILAFSLTALAGTIKLFNAIDINTLFEGGGKIAMVLAMIGLAMRTFPEKGAVGSAASILIMAGALVIIAKALQMVATLTGGDSAQALITLGVLLYMIAAACDAMMVAMPGAQAMIVVAGAIALLSASLIMLGKQPLSVLAVGLGALAAMLIVLGLAAAALLYSGAIAGLMLMGPAILSIGLGIAAVGGGMLLFAMGLTMLAAMGSAATALLIDNINTFLEAVPGFIQRAGKSFIEIANQLALAAPAFARAAGVALRALLQQIIKTVPLIGKTFRVVIAEALKTLRSAVPDMIRTGFVILNAFLGGVLRNIAHITQTAVSIIVRFINGIADNMDRIVRAGTNLAVRFVQAVGRELGERARGLASDAGDLAMHLVTGMRDGLSNAWHMVTDVVGDLIARIPKRIREIMGIASPSKVMHKLGGWITKGLGLGIDDGSAEVSKSADDMARGALRTIHAAMSSMSDLAIGDINPTITPVLDLSRLQQDATKISSLLDTAPITTGVTYSQAASISSERLAAAEAAAAVSSAPSDIKFEQNIHAPKALDAVTIYRQTKNQLSLAKEALQS